MSGWLKRLREKLRRKKPALLLGSLLAVLVFLGSMAWLVLKQAESVDEAAGGVKSALAPRQVEVILQKEYVAGPIEVERRLVPADEMAEISGKYKDWELIKGDGDQLVYRQKINDLSPVLKEKGVFGIGPDGTLTVYEGEPSDDRIIQTFFQLDLERLESVLPKEEFQMLKSGIRFHSLEEYNSILSTFGEFAVFEEE